MTTNELMLGFYMLSLDPKDKDYDEKLEKAKEMLDTMEHKEGME